MVPLAAGVDDAGEQGENPRADWGAGAQTELAQDDPVPQGAFGVVVSQRQPGMTQDLEDDRPVVEQLHRQGVGFGVGVTLALFAGRAQRGQCQCLWGRQRNRGRTFTGRIHRRHQAFQSTQDEHAKDPGLAVATLYQAPRLADQVRPAAQPAWIVPVGPPAVAHQPAGEALQHVFQQFLAAPGNIIEGHRQRPEHLEPQSLVVFRPRRFVGVQQRAGEHRLNELIFHRGHRRAGFVERPMDRADT